MTGIRRGSSFIDPSKIDQLRKRVSIEQQRENERRPEGVRRRHHSLLLSHFVSTVIHLISSVLLYLSWNSADLTCGETSIFLTNLQAVLIGIYAITIVVKTVLLAKHFCHLHLPVKYITVISAIISAKQFILAVICEVFLEASTMVPRTGCPNLRDTVPVWSSRVFYLISIIANAFFFSVSNKLHPSAEEESEQ